MVAYRRVWQGVEFGLIGLVAGLLVLGGRLLMQTAAVFVPAADPGGEPAPAAVQPLAAYAAIEHRNIFGSTAGTRPTAPAIILRGVGLIGGSVRAVIEDPTSHAQRLVAVGDAIDDGVVTAIAWDHLTLDTPAGALTARLAPPGQAARPTPPTAAPPVTAPVREGVRRTGTNAFIVDRRALAAALDGMSGLMSQMRAIAEVEDGRATGFRIFQLAEDSLFTELGLTNGDVVQRINGKAVTDPAALLGFLKQLRTEPRVALDVVRAGTARTLVYDLR